MNEKEFSLKYVSAECTHECVWVCVGEDVCVNVYMCFVCT